MPYDVPSGDGGVRAVARGRIGSCTGARAKGETLTAPNPDPPRKTPRSRLPLEAIPVWLQALAAVAAVVVSAAALVVTANPAPQATATPPTQPTPSQPEPTAEPRVTLETVLTSATEVRASGAFEGLNPESQAVIFIGQPVADASATWLPVVATTVPATTAPNGTANGAWEAVRPGVGDEPYQWYAVIGPRGALGLADTDTDLRRNGPDSRFVISASQLVTTDE